MADDRDVWERICRRDESAFDALYRTHGPKMQMFLRRLLGNSQAAEDVMQETFAAIWQHPNGFAVERGTLRAYLFGAARKCAADWWRKQGASGEQVQSEPAQAEAWVLHCGQALLLPPSIRLEPKRAV